MVGWTSPTHIAMLFLIAFLLFGAKRLPEIGRSLGLGMREFKDGVTGVAAPEPAQQPLPVAGENIFVASTADAVTVQPAD